MASRYAPLCQWGESATKFTMNVSMKTSCFRSRTPMSEVVDRASPIEALPLAALFIVPAYSWVKFGSYAKTCYGKSFYSGFLLILEPQGKHEYYSLTKNEEPTHFLQPPAIDKKAKSNAKKYM